MSTVTMLRHGTIVKVIGEQCTHPNCKGQVVGYDLSDSEERIVQVWFGREFDYLIHHEVRAKYSGEEQSRFYASPPPPDSVKDNMYRVYNFRPDEIEVCNEGWDSKTLIERVFGTNYFYTEHRKRPEVFVPGSNDCDIESCSHKTTEQILFAVWNTVYFLDVCSTCAKKYHGHAGDSLPAVKHRTVHQT